MKQISRRNDLTSCIAPGLLWLRIGLCGGCLTGITTAEPLAMPSVMLSAYVAAIERSPRPMGCMCAWWCWSGQNGGAYRRHRCDRQLPILH